MVEAGRCFLPASNHFIAVCRRARPFLFLSPLLHFSLVTTHLAPREQQRLDGYCVTAESLFS